MGGRAASKWGVGQRRKLPPCGRTGDDDAPAGEEASAATGAGAGGRGRADAAALK